MPGRSVVTRRWLALVVVGVILLLGVAAGVFWGDLARTMLDPKQPFQLYRPPPAPDYARPAAWALAPTTRSRPTRAEPPADIFFISPTTYDGGRDWNAPIDEPHSNRLFERVMAPNYAGPFVRVGRIFAPRYRQASLYSQLTLREDAREARRFAYGDVQRAFRFYLEHDNGGRPFILVGVEQGGVLGARLLAEEVARAPAVRARLVAAYLIETVAPADATPVPACMAKGEAGCLAAWASVPDGQFESADTLLDRALVWTAAGELDNLNDRPALCFNPLLGAVTEAPAGPKLHLGAANATGLEWGARPAFLARQVSAQCVAGVLRVSHPKSASLRPQGGWADRRKAPGYNLFYADLEADAKDAWPPGYGGPLALLRGRQEVGSGDRGSGLRLLRLAGLAVRFLLAFGHWLVLRLASGGVARRLKGCAIFGGLQVASGLGDAQVFLVRELTPPARGLLELVADLNEVGGGSRHGELVGFDPVFGGADSVVGHGLYWPPLKGLEGCGALRPCMRSTICRSRWTSASTAIRSLCSCALRLCK